VLYAHELGLVPITTPAYSPESNGLAEAFVGTFKRDYLGDAELRDAETVLAQLSGWFDDYNTLAPHSALGRCSLPSTHTDTEPTTLRRPALCRIARAHNASPIAGRRKRIDSSDVSAIGSMRPIARAASAWS